MHSIGNPFEHFQNIIEGFRLGFLKRGIRETVVDTGNLPEGKKHNFRKEQPQVPCVTFFLGHHDLLHQLNKIVLHLWELLRNLGNPLAHLS
jgi:hypothetical protein